MSGTEVISQKAPRRLTQHGLQVVAVLPAADESLSGIVGPLGVVLLRFQPVKEVRGLFRNALMLDARTFKRCAGSSVE